MQCDKFSTFSNHPLSFNEFTKWEAKDSKAKVLQTGQLKWFTKTKFILAFIFLEALDGMDGTFQSEKWDNFRW